MSCSVLHDTICFDSKTLIVSFINNKLIVFKSFIAHDVFLVQPHLQTCLRQERQRKRCYYSFFIMSHVFAKH